MASKDGYSPDRREFLSTAALTGGFLLANGLLKKAGAATYTGIQQPPLPYKPNELEPYLSARTLELHHGKHHKKYIDVLNKLITGTPYDGMTLEQIIPSANGKEEHLAILNNAILAWNHNFYWNSMRPGGGGVPGERILKRINTSFGSYESFKKQFIAKASESVHGWAWVVADKHNLEIMRTEYTFTPLNMNRKPLVTVDLWEHAFYLDYQNRLDLYLNAYVDHLLNWDFFSANLP